MERFSYLTKSPRVLADFLELMQSDGLQAKGCSLDLLFPEEEVGSWEDWLEHDNPVSDECDISDEIEAMRRAVNKAAEIRRHINE